MAVKVKQRKGKWRVFINHKGQRKAKCIGSKKAAQEVAAKVEARLTLGLMALPAAEGTPETRLTEYADEWLQTYAAVRCKASTVSEYESMLRRYLIPEFGSKALTAITREDIKRGVVKWLKRPTSVAPIEEKTDLGGMLSRTRVYMILRLLGGIYTSALEDGKAAVNPAAKPGRFLPKRIHTHEHIRFMTKEELAEVLAVIQQDWPEEYPVFLTLARTGMRLSEVRALRWEFIDWRGGFIEVHQGLRRGVVSSPKSKKSRRVDMSRQLQDTLRALLATRQEQAWRYGWAEVPGWVFCSPAGKPVDDTLLRREIWHPALVRAGLRRMRIHDLRHTFASLLLQQGASLLYVKEQLGHHSIQITADIYGHLVPGGNRQAVDKLDDAHATIRNPDATYSISESGDSSLSPRRTSENRTIT